MSTLKKVGTYWVYKSVLSRYYKIVAIHDHGTVYEIENEDGEILEYQAQYCSSDIKATTEEWLIACLK